jgi:hypothetical protein
MADLHLDLVKTLDILLERYRFKVTKQSNAQDCHFGKTP